jgi:hypothetical protein
VYEWVLPDIFAPFRAEYLSGAEFGTLWDPWLAEMETAVAKLRERYGAPKEGTTCQSALVEWNEKFEQAAEYMEHEQVAEEES